MPTLRILELGDNRFFQMEPMRSLWGTLSFLFLAVGAAILGTFAVKSEIKASGKTHQFISVAVCVVLTFIFLKILSYTGNDLSMYVACTVSPEDEYCAENPKLDLFRGLKKQLRASNEAARTRSPRQPDPAPEEWDKFSYGLDRRDKYVVERRPITNKKIEALDAFPFSLFGSKPARWAVGYPKPEGDIVSNELVLWDWVLDQRDACEPLRAYLERYPSGLFAKEAFASLQNISTGTMSITVPSNDKHGPFIIKDNGQPTKISPIEACTLASRKISDAMRGRCKAMRGGYLYSPRYSLPTSTIKQPALGSCTCRDNTFWKSHYDCKIKVEYDCDYVESIRENWESCP